MAAENLIFFNLKVHNIAFISITLMCEQSRHPSLKSFSLLDRVGSLSQLVKVMKKLNFFPVSGIDNPLKRFMKLFSLVFQRTNSNFQILFIRLK